MQNWQKQFLLKPDLSIFEISYLSNLVGIGQCLKTTQQNVMYDITINISKSHNY